MKPIVIAIDGTAASGKGTLGRMLANELSYAYLDSGKLYRYIGYQTLISGGNPAIEADAMDIAKNMAEAIARDVLSEPSLGSDEAGQAASKVAVFSNIRNLLKDIQKDFALCPPGGKEGAVIDGRDIGTVICPNADVKFYIDARQEIRAERRHKELQSKGISVTYDAVLADMRERDKRDAGRDTAPMKAADDALVIDTSDLSIESAFADLLVHVRRTTEPQ